MIPTEDLLDDVIRLWRDLSGGPPGRFPTYQQYEDHGRYSCPTLRNRIGKWPAVRMAVERRFAASS